MQEFKIFNRNFEKQPFIIKYLYNIIYLLDCSANVLFLFGDPTVTISQNLGYVKERKKKLFGKININPIIKIVDFITFEKDHCKKSYLKYGKREWVWCNSYKLFK